MTLRSDFANQALAEARHTASQIDSSNYHERTESFANIALVLAKRGEVRTAYQIVAETASPAWPYHTSPDFTEWVVKSIQWLASKGEHAKARHAARQLQGPRRQLKAFVAIAEITNDPRDLEEARCLATTIRDRSQRAHSFAVIAGRSREARDFEEALAIAHSLKGRTSSAVFDSIALAYRMAGNFNEALAAASEIRSKRLRADTISFITAVRSASDNRQAALEAAAAIRDEELRAHALLLIADAAVMAGDFEAVKSAVNATTQLDAVPDIMGGISGAFAMLRRLIHWKAFQTARQVAEGFDHTYHRLTAFAEIAQASGDPHDLETVRRIATELGDDQGILTSSAATTVVQTMAAVGEFKAAEEIAMAMDDSSGERSQALAGIAAALLARSTPEAHRVAARISRPASRAWAYAVIALKSNERDDFIAALEAAKAVESLRWRTSALTEIVEMWL